MKLLLIDESKAKNYTLCVVELAHDSAPLVRKIVNKSRRKSQRQVHFVKEGATSKRQILKNFATVGCDVTFFVVKGKSENESRKLCIEALINSICPDDTYSLIFDRDESQVPNDKRVLSDALKARGLDITVEYRHEEPHIECLLWLPDALAWSAARGGEWKNLLADFNVKTVILH